MKLKTTSIASKLAVVTSLIVFVGFAALTYVSSAYIRRDAEHRTIETLDTQVTQVLHVLEMYDASLRQSVEATSRVLMTQFPAGFTLDTTTSVAVNGLESPLLKTGGKALNNDFSDLDRFTATTGAVATLFARSGDDFQRVSTSLKKQDGSRAVGTRLDRDHPAYATILSKGSFTGKAVLFGRHYMTRYVPLENPSGEVIGALFVGLDLTQGFKELSTRVRMLKVGESGYFYALDATPGNSEGMLMIHPAVEGTSILNAKDSDGREFIKEMLRNKKGVIHYPWINKELGDTTARDKTVVYGHFAPWNWLVAGGTYTDELQRAQLRLAEILFAAGITAMLVTCVLLYSTVRVLVIRPLREAAAIAAQVAKGDLTATLETKRKDEIGILLRGLADMSKKLHATVLEVLRGSENVATASKEIAAGNSDLSHRTEEHAASLEETASSMEELTSTVKQNTSNARQANQLAAGASAMAVKGGEMVAQVVSSISSINDSSRKIVDIIGVIDGIAFQTNILALNAAVEAARAGEQGRGFAVVASEVRTLAQRSAAAAKEIKALITDSVVKVEDGTRLVDEAGKTMEGIVSSVKRVTDIMAEIAAASEEQTSGIEQVNQAIVQMDQVTQQNTALVEEAAAAAESMQQQSRSLIKAVSTFKLSAADSSASCVDAEAEAAFAHTKDDEGATGVWDGATERRGPHRAKNITRLPSASA